MPVEAVLVAIGAAVWKLFKELPEIFSGRNKRLQEEAEFADKFFARVHQGDISPFAKEKGYQALARSRLVTAHEVQAIFSIKQCPRLLRDFVAGRAYIELVKLRGESIFVFKKKYRSASSRACRKIFYFLLYIISFVAAISPLIWAGMLSDLKLIHYFLFIGPCFLLLAYISVAEGHNIKCAEDVIGSQVPHCDSDSSTS
jgi:hypothetical protein